MKRLVLLFLMTSFLGVLAAPAQSVAKMPRKKARPTNTVVPKKKIRVACVGNSITYGHRLENREQEAYPARLQEMLGTDYEVGNFGKNSATLMRRGYLPYFEQKEYHEAMRFAGDIVIIHLGVNDTDPKVWPNYRDDFVRDYCDLIDSLRSVNPKARVLIASITPIADRHKRFLSGTKDWQDQIRTEIQTVARVSGAELIDFYTPLYSQQWLLHDAIHPDAEGASLLARIVFEAITGNYGGLQLPPTFSDNMVLQRETELHLSGTANAGDEIEAVLVDKKGNIVASADALTNNQGHWTLTLPPLTAADELELSFTARHQGKETRKTFRHVAVGEVWICSGQSNMAFRLEQTGEHADIAQAADPLLRLFDMKERWPTTDVAWSESAIDSVRHLLYYKNASWAEASPETAARFSAVAYYFGRMLRDSLQVPVGLICNAIGGSPAESWIDRDALERHFPQILKDWLHNDLVQDWCRGRAARNLGMGGEVPTIYINQPTDDFRRRHPYEPCYLYEAGILPLAKYPVCGAIWYQGESNAHNVEAHERLFPLLVDSWRKYWDNPRMPFLFVQLSSHNRPSWTWFRNSQRLLAEKTKHCAMAVCSDVGDSLDVHPIRKQPVGERLARQALAGVYGHSLVPSGPQFVRAERKDNRLILHFLHSEGLRTADELPLRTFEVAAEEGMFHPAKATIKGNCVILESEAVKRPRLVRYGWQPFTRANLVNGENLPASTFRAEAD